MSKPLTKPGKCCDRVLFLRIIGPDRRALVECGGKDRHTSVQGVPVPIPASEFGLN